jgi:hypothetical protein
MAVTGGSGEFRAALGDGVLVEAEDQTATLTLSLQRPHRGGYELCGSP